MNLSKLEILENTKLIMTFMGLTPQFELATKYHKSWDWLLPVYVKASEQIVPSIMANRKINVKAANHIVIASNGVPFIGRTYIIEVLEYGYIHTDVAALEDPLHKDITLPYTHMVFPELYLELKQ